MRQGADREMRTGGEEAVWPGAQTTLQRMIGALSIIIK